MAKIIYKVAPKGEGKTKWLVSQAESELATGAEVFYLSTKSTQDYHKFCDHYFVTTGCVCHVKPLELYEELTEESVVLIDDAFCHELIGSFISILSGICKKIYVTVEGELG